MNCYFIDFHSLYGALSTTALEVLRAKTRRIELKYHLSYLKSAPPFDKLSKDQFHTMRDKVILNSISKLHIALSMQILIMNLVFASVRSNRDSYVQIGCSERILHRRVCI